MNISHQIKLCRENKGYSQEYLAEKLYVSRQTISNWENERSYPDVHNLIMMCELFNVSLDDLVQGEIHMEQRELVKKKFDFWTYIMLILLIGSLILLGPLIVFLSWWGFAIFLLLYLVGIYAGGNVDKIKYKNGMDNYDRIVAFMNGKDPNEVNVSKRRAVLTDIIIFILVSGGYGAIGGLSIYLAFKFL